MQRYNFILNLQAIYLKNSRLFFTFARTKETRL